MNLDFLEHAPVLEKQSGNPIKGKIACILDATQVVLNIGSGAGVKPGMILAILSNKSITVLDPKTGKVLDTIIRAKARIRVDEVRPNICICSKIDSFRENRRGYQPSEAVNTGDDVMENVK